MIAADAITLYKKQALERMSLGGGNKRSKAPRPGCANLHTPAPEDVGRASEKAGEAVGVSGRTVDQAVRVKKEGALELNRPPPPRSRCHF